MKLNDLDCLQNDVLSLQSNNSDGCVDCKYSPDGFNCSHKISNGIVGDLRAFYGIPSLIAGYMLCHRNDLDLLYFSDGGSGRYCKLFEREDWNEQS